MGRIIGIDLGTCNSCMAVLENGKPVIIPNKEGKNTTPSIVTFNKDGSIDVGETAQRKAVLQPERTSVSIKRTMGSDFKLSIDGKDYTPQEISAMILKKLKTDAEKYLGEKVTEAVITVPAYFNDAQRQATKDAGRIAGLDVKRIINEPTAAALAYGLSTDSSETIAVYDLGGGTFDISILDIDDGVFEVLASNGDTYLGGNDYDEIIVEFIKKKLKKKYRYTPDAIGKERIKNAAEKAKRELSIKQVTEVRIPYLTDKVSLEMSVERVELEVMSSSLTNRTIKIIEKTIKEAELNEVDKIILVGGSTRMPLVFTALKNFFKKEPLKCVNPDEAVAIGAAIEADKLSGSCQLALTGKSDIVLLDITPFTLSTNLTNIGKAVPVIRKNSSIPCKNTVVFYNDFHDHTNVGVYQGESERYKENIKMGEINLPHPWSELGSRKVSITFSVDTNGIINATAKDLQTGKDMSCKLNFNSRMSDLQIEESKRKVLLLESK